MDDLTSFLLTIVTDKDAKVISYADATGGKEGKEGERREKVKLIKVNNVSGSSAGAGSGEFHEYRNARRKESFRLAAMDREAKIEATEVSNTHP